jgi:glycosyltransferase involved in cell wall biosynthesis
VKILVLSNLYPPDVLGGYELGCKQAVDGLRARGHEVRVLTSTPRLAIHGADEPHVLRRFGLSDLWYNATRHASLASVNKVWDVDANWFSAHNVHALIQEVESFRPDVAYPWMLLGLGGLGLIGCLQYLKLPWVWHLMDEVPTQLVSTNYKVVPELARLYDRFIYGHYAACSRALVERIEAKGIKLAGEVEVIPNWLVGDRPAPRVDFYHGGTLRIISAGRVIREKGVDLLVEAARLLRDEGRDGFVIDVYGPLIDRSIPDLARSLELGDVVRFHGAIPQPELFCRLAEADLFAFPTEEREPFGFAPLEAAAHGCVPVMSRACGISEWLVHRVHCLKVGRTARQFADAIASVIRGEVDLAPIARRAQAVVWRDFHRDAILPRVERLLVRAAGADRSGGGSADDAYRMALIAEKLAHALVQEPFCA